MNNMNNQQPTSTICYSISMSWAPRINNSTISGERDKRFWLTTNDAVENERSQTASLGIAENTFRATLYNPGKIFLWLNQYSSIDFSCFVAISCMKAVHSSKVEVWSSSSSPSKTIFLRLSCFIETVWIGSLDELDGVYFLYNSMIKLVPWKFNFYKQYSSAQLRNIWLELNYLDYVSIFLSSIVLLVKYLFNFLRCASTHHFVSRR